MIDPAAHLGRTLSESHLKLPGLRRGKVRDVYDLGDQLLLVATDRLSAFDVVLTTVPFKGQVLTEMAVHWFHATADVAPNHLIAHPDPVAMLARKCQAVPVEVVVRGYLTGSYWRDYERGDDPYAIGLPRGMRPAQRFETPIITPATKEEVGKHDEPLSVRAVVERGLAQADVWEEIQRRALALFARGQKLAAERGLILVDTKYEFGLAGGEIYVIDEIHTPDSSRYWEASEYEERFAAGRDQRMLDKENLRQFLIRERGYMGQGPMPSIPDDFRANLSRIYLTAFERITGRPFEAAAGDPQERLEKNLRAAGVLP